MAVTNWMSVMSTLVFGGYGKSRSNVAVSIFKVPLLRRVYVPTAGGSLTTGYVGTS